MAKTKPMNKKAPNKPKIKEDRSILPLDIIETILSRLPLKSVLRFKTVSKSWNAITSNNPRFASIHLNQSKTDNADHDLFLQQSYVTGKYNLGKFENHKIRTKAAFKFPFMKYCYQEHVLLCTCDGFLLMKIDRDSHNTYVLWNPITKAYRLFFSPYFVNLKNSTFGICHDPSTDDYKIVLVSKKYYAVFSYKNNSWTEKKEFHYSGISEDAGISVNGVLYWVAIRRKKLLESRGYYRKHYNKFLEFGEGTFSPGSYLRECLSCECDDHFTHDIIYFDHKDDEFKKFHKPDGIEKDEQVIYLTTLRGCLCLYQNSVDRKLIRLWILEDDLWTDFMIIEGVPWRWPWRCDIVKPMCLTNNEIVLQFNCHDGEAKFVVYNYKEKKYTKLWNFGIVEVSHAVTCLVSLVLPTRDKRSSYSKYCMTMT